MMIDSSTPDSASTNDSSLLADRQLDQLLSCKGQIPDDLHAYLVKEAARDRVDNPLAERWDRLLGRLSDVPELLFNVTLGSAVADVPFHEALIPLICADAADRKDLFRRANLGGDSIVRKYATHLCVELSEIVRYVLLTDLSEYDAGRFHAIPTGQRRPVYDDYVASLVTDGWRRIGITYPVLAHRIIQRLDTVARSVSDLAMRLESDFEAVMELIEFADPEAAVPTVTDIEFGLSDPHAGGASTVRLEFDYRASVFYKPKSMANERWFTEDFLSAIQPRGFQAISVVDRTSHGWARDANTTDSLGNPAAVDAGESLAIAYVLNATDLHCENVLFTDNGMAWIDLEMLFTPPTAYDERPGVIGTSAIDSGLVWSSACRDPLKRDPSGLFGSGVFDLLPTVQFDACGSDGIAVDFNRSANQERSFRSRRALPFETLDSATIASRFTDCVHRLRGDRRLPSILERASGGRVRYVFRPTAFYYRLRHKLLQPRFLRSAQAQQMELLQLFQECVGLEPSDATTMASLIKAEISQLEGGDIPIFWSDYESCDLESPGGPVCPSYFAASPSESVTRKMEELTENSIHEQASVLRTILDVCQDLGTTPSGDGDSTSSDASHQFASHEPLLETVVEDLLDSALVTSAGVTSWVSFHGAVDGDRLFPRADVYTPYGGSFGVLYYLSCMDDAQCLSRSNATRLAGFLDDLGRDPSAALGNTALAKALSERPGLDGLGGLFVAASQETPRCTQLFGDLVEVALNGRETEILQSLAQEPSGDIVNGYAGLAIGLATYLRRKGLDTAHSQTDAVLRLLEACILSILERPNYERQSPIWFAGPASFSHGRLGFAAALADGYEALAAIRPQPPTLDSRVRAFVAESLRACSMQPDQWSDAAIDEQSNTSWCHGLAGAGYAHLLLSRLDPSHLEIAGRVARSLMTRPAHAIDCFCCGEAGVAEFLRLYGTVADDSSTRTSGERRIAAIGSRWQRTGKFAGSWGPTRSAQFPGFFQGASGLGHGLLNSMDPSFVGLGMPFRASIASIPTGVDCGTAAPVTISLT